MKTRKIFTALIITSAITLFSCASTPTVAENLTPSQIIQQGQTAYDKGDYNAALFYYEEVISRFGTEPSVAVEANYEIGHIYAKINKKSEAERYFNVVLEIYNNYGMYLPQQYKKLSLMGLNSLKN